jgi:hypothetical protein
MEMRPWMVQTAYEYLKAARLLWMNNLSVPSSVSAAIGVEILLKSFLVEINGESGGLGEQYLFNNKKYQIRNSGHNLLDLFNAIPDNIKTELNLHKYKEYFRNYFKTSFLDDRYPYEKKASGGYSEVLTDIGDEILSVIIKWYKENKCNDPWIEKYPDV